MSVPQNKLATLKEEVETDPLNRGYVSMTNLEIAESLREVRDRPGPVPARDVLKHALATDFWVKVDSDAKGNNPKIVSRKAAMLLERIELLEFIDMDDPVSQGLLTLLVSNNVVTQAEADAFEALKNNRRTRAEELEFGRVLEGDIVRAKELP